MTPLLSAHGLTATWTTKQEADKGNLAVTCRITHEQGHSEDTTLTGPYDTSGNKNPIQAIGSAATYLARYTFLLATGIATSDMGDDDGIGAGPRVENEGRGAAGSPRDESSPSRPGTPSPPSSAGAPTPPPWHEDEMPFGKHKGVKFCDLPGDYLDWLSERPPDPKYKPDARTKAIGELEYRAQAQAGQSAPAAAPAPSGCPDGFGPDSRPHGGEYPGVRIRHMPDAWLDRAAKHPGQWGEAATAERDRRKQCGQRPIAEPATSEARASFAAELRNGYEPSDDGAGCEEPPLSYPPDDGEVEPGELEPELAEDILPF